MLTKGIPGLDGIGSSAPDPLPKHSGTQRASDTGLSYLSVGGNALLIAAEHFPGIGTSKLPANRKVLR